jgi:hypothetical protein
MIICCYGDDLAGFINDDFHAPPPVQARRSAQSRPYRKLSNLLSARGVPTVKITASEFARSRNDVACEAAGK